MRFVSKTVIALLAAYGASFAFYETQWVFKNFKRVAKDAEEGRPVFTELPRWHLIKK